MKKLLLLLIPLLFISCELENERGEFIIFNETPVDLTIELKCSRQKKISKFTLYSRLDCTDHLINCDYTLKVKNRKRPEDDWTTFVFHPTCTYIQYYITGTETSFFMSSGTGNGKSEDIKRIPPSTE